MCHWVSSMYKAGTYIELNPGFVSGTDFVAEIVEVTDCGQPDGEQSNYSKTDIKFSDYVSENLMKLIPNFRVSPNPTSDKITVSAEFSNNGNAEFTIYDFTGKAVKKLGKQSISSGKFSKEFNLVDFANGVYFIFLSLDNQEALSFKIIKNN